MPLLFPLGIAAVLTLALTYETGKNAKRKLETKNIDYIIATASTKPLNLATNVGSAIAFVMAGKVLWMIAIPMAIANMSGSYVGTHFAIKGGEVFIKKVLIFVLIFMLLANIIKIVLEN